MSGLVGGSSLRQYVSHGGLGGGWQQVRAALGRFGVYLDPQNATNRANSESVGHSVDARQTSVQTRPPIIPSFGVKGQW